MKLKKGLVHIYTGEGKGKTTAALGLGLRSLGCGMRVQVFQFFKDKKFPCGEAAALKRLGGNFRLKRFDIPHPMFEKMAAARFKARLRAALEEAGRLIKSEKADLVILDEVLVGVAQGFIDEGRLVDMMRTKPENLELVLTGRGATRRIIECADYVTHMTEIKHPFTKGLGARRGVEF